MIYHLWTNNATSSTSREQAAGSTGASSALLDLANAESMDLMPASVDEIIATVWARSMHRFSDPNAPLGRPSERQSSSLTKWVSATPTSLSFRPGDLPSAAAAYRDRRPGAGRLSCFCVGDEDVRRADRRHRGPVRNLVQLVWRGSLVGGS